MQAVPPPERLRFTTRSLLVAVALLGATLLFLRVFASSHRVLGWIASATAVAGLLHPPVESLSRRMPRAVAVLVVVVTLLAGIGIIGYAVIDDVRRETKSVQESLPRAARRLEREGRFRNSARDYHLADRTERLVKDIPKRLQGGTTATALRSAATRGVAFLATGVLTIFFLVHGPRLLAGAAGQITDPRRRARFERVGVAAYHRAVTYLGGSLLMAVSAGLMGFLVASIAEVPGPATLAVWLGLWDLVPVVGTFIGGLPIIVLAGLVAHHASGTKAIAVAIVIVLYQVFEVLVLQRRVEARSLHVGAFLTVAGGLIGIELYGIGGGLLGLIVITLGLAVAEEMAPE